MLQHKHSSKLNNDDVLRRKLCGPRCHEVNSFMILKKHGYFGLSL